VFCSAEKSGNRENKNEREKKTNLKFHRGDFGCCLLLIDIRATPIAYSVIHTDWVMIAAAWRYIQMAIHHPRVHPLTINKL